MMNRTTLLGGMLTMLAFLHCNDQRHDTVMVELNIVNARNTHLYLVKRGYFREKDQVIDSAVVRPGNKPIIFNIPKEIDRIYYIRVKESGRRFEFIPDAPVIGINANNINGRYTTEGSTASRSLKQLTDSQTGTAILLGTLYKKRDSLLQKEAASPLIHSINKTADSLFKMMNQSRLNYADTVANPAAFVAVYNMIEFGTDHTAWKQMIDRNAARFPAVGVVQELKRRAFDLVDILEKELNPGDTIPDFQLPDNNRILFSTASLKGKYYLIDCWSTWCHECIVYHQPKKEAAKQFPAGKFAMVSVAIDDNEEDWRKQIQANQFNWIQLIDEEMWTGIAARSMKFDSIPYNFLVSPAGIILQKGIPADSLLQVLHRYIK